MRRHALYTCCVCGLDIDPSGAMSERLVTVWLKSNSKTVTQVEEEMYKYKHQFCKETATEFVQDAMF